MALTLPFVGNLTADPTLNFTQSGTAVSNFTVAHTPKKFDKQANEWKDLETLFFRCTLWGQEAENAAESLAKGMRVTGLGALRKETWTDDNGNERTSDVIDVYEIGPSIKYATARVTKNQRDNQGGGGYTNGGGSPQGGSYGQNAPQGGNYGGGHDPWRQNTGGNDWQGNWPEQGQQRPPQQGSHGGYGGPPAGPPQGGNGPQNGPQSGPPPQQNGGNNQGAFWDQTNNEEPPF